MNTEPSCDILCTRSLLRPGLCYGGPRLTQSHLVPFFVLAIYSSLVHVSGVTGEYIEILRHSFVLALHSSLVNVTGVPGEYRAILRHYLASLSTTPPWSMLRGSQVNTCFFLAL